MSQKQYLRHGLISLDHVTLCVCALTEFSPLGSPSRLQVIIASVGSILKINQMLHYRLISMRLIQMCVCKFWLIVVANGEKPYHNADGRDASYLPTRYTSPPVIGSPNLHY